MSVVQTIEINGAPAFYVVPADLWAQVKDLIEDAEDAADYERAVAEDDGTRIPLAVVKAKLDGAHPVKAWREYRGLTVQQLATAAGLSKAFVSQIETAQRVGTAATLKKLATALNANVGALLL